MATKKKTGSRNDAAKRKKARARKKLVKKVKKVTVKKYKKTKRATVRKYKKVKRAAIRKKKRVVRSLKRTKKRTVKAFKKRSRRINRERTRAFQKQFRRRTLKDEIDIATTSSRRAASEDTAFIEEFAETKGASRPGEPPKMRSGKGRMAIKSQLISHRTKRDNITSRVYVDKRKAGYMAMWEYRRDGEQRPFLKPAMRNNSKMLGSIIGRKLKSKLKALK